MKISELSEAQFRKYYETRLADKRLRKSGIGWMALCCFHSDRNPSLSLNFEKGVWHCHTGCGSGGVIEFEMKFSGCDKDAAIGRIADILGERHLNLGSQPEAVYPYTDAFGKLAFQVVRYPGKRFTQRRPKDDGGWEYKTQGMKMLLYNLPDVVAARNVLIVEGEKAANYMKAAIASKEIRDLAVTTSPRGAGKWLDEFGVYMAGKQVAIFEDNDEPGRKHAKVTAHSCFKYAQAVKLMSLPDMPEKAGPDDFVEKFGIDALLALWKKAGWWKPDLGGGDSLFLDYPQFMEKTPEYIDWIVEGFAQRGANGMIIGRPKGGKSFAVSDLAIALASGQSWLGFHVPKRVKVGLVSREDTFGLTQWRAKKIAAARNLSQQDLSGWLRINAKGLKPKILLDDPADVAALVADVKRYEIEFLILDVMRVLHGSDENDNTDMQKVIDVLNSIQAETGTSLCLIHHSNKREEATLTEHVRGASAITGWCEFLGEISVVEEAEWTRALAVEIKADMAPSKFYWRITDTADGGVELKKVDYVPDPPRKRGSKKEEPEPETPF